MLHAQHWGARWPCDLYGRTSGSVCLGRELWAESLPPRHPRAPSVTLKQSENNEQQKSKMQEQAVKLYGQLLNELIILGFFLLYSFLMLSNYYCDCCRTTKVFVRLHTLLASKTSINTLQTRDNRHLRYRKNFDQCFDFKWKSQFFQAFWGGSWKTEDGEISQLVAGVEEDIEKKWPVAWVRHKRTSPAPDAGSAKPV